MHVDQACLLSDHDRDFVLVMRLVPLAPPRVTFYMCGPTVYNFAHIGNFRTFVFGDLLRRYLEYSGYDVFMIMNLTDVDDRTIKAAADYLRFMADALHVEIGMVSTGPERDAGFVVAGTKFASWF